MPIQKMAVANIMKDMKVHTTNYFNTFIEVAADTKVSCGTRPPAKDKKTVAALQYELIAGDPYKYTSDDVLFRVFAFRKDLAPEAYKLARTQFFSKGQACLRASPLTKNYGFGIHCNEEGKVALCGMETKDYERFLSDRGIKKVKAMRSGK